MLVYRQIIRFGGIFMNEPFVSRLFRVILYIAFALGFVVVVTLPFLLNFYAGLIHDGYYVIGSYKAFITVFLVFAGIIGLWIIAELILIMRTVRGDAFIRRNVSALRRIGILALVLGVWFLLKCIRFATFLTLVCGVVLIVCSLIVFTLGALFAQAVQYKEDNELTI